MRTRPRPAASAPPARPLPLNPLPADAPDPMRAVSLGLALLRTARVEAWDDLIAALRDDHPAVTARLATLDLTGEDLALLDAHLGLLALIRVAPASRGRGGHTVTVAVCDTCGRWHAQHRRRTPPLPAHHRLPRDRRQGGTGETPETRCTSDRSSAPLTRIRPARARADARSRAAHIQHMVNRVEPLDRFVIPRRGPIRERKSGAGPHAQGIRRRRTRGQQRRAAITEQHEPRRS